MIISSVRLAPTYKVNTNYISVIWSMLFHFLTFSCNDETKGRIKLLLYIPTGSLPIVIAKFGSIALATSSPEIATEILCKTQHL